MEAQTRTKFAAPCGPKPVESRQILDRPDNSPVVVSMTIQAAPETITRPNHGHFQLPATFLITGYRLRLTGWPEVNRQEFGGKPGSGFHVLPVMEAVPGARQDFHNGP